MRADIHDGREHMRSKQRPDTLMQDRSPPGRRNLLATHGRTIHWVTPGNSTREHNESASLIGRLRSSTFRPSATAMSMSLTGSCFSSESAPEPLYGASFVKKFGSATHVFLRQFLCSI